jgi:hypothetical protein
MMIDYSEIRDYEEFEDLCEDLLKAQGLATRRLGRGPGQRGKDIIAHERVVSPLSDHQSRKWLVECKFTGGNRSIDETDVLNLRDRVEGEGAYGYMLFTNCRLKVNLEKTLHDLKQSGKMGILIWTSSIIAAKVLLYPEVFRTFFPKSFVEWVRENRFIYLNQIRALKSPLVYITNYIYFLKSAPKNVLNSDNQNRIFDDLLYSLNTMIDDLDTKLGIIFDTEMQ